MKLQMVGCSHHNSSVEVRERLAFNTDQVRAALAELRRQYPHGEAVLLSTCNRVELYTAARDAQECPTHHDMVEFLAGFHGLDAVEIFNDLFERTGEDAVRHLFTVAASLDSMVVGEAQILSQVKEAYELATSGDATGPLTHSVFQAAMRVAKRVASETAINRRRVSIPSVAVADFAAGIFERFDDKQVLVIGAGEMGEETLRYLVDAGARRISIVSRRTERAEKLAASFNGRAQPWDQLDELLVKSDLVISATGAAEPIITLQRFRRIEPRRFQRTLFILDLAVPRDFEPAVGNCLGVYLYSIDDLDQACQRNRAARAAELPAAEKIVVQETGRFAAEVHRRATAPIITGLRAGLERPKEAELQRLFHKLPDLDEQSRQEIERFADRLVNKMLHPPLESLRDASQNGTPHGLIDALRRLFRLED